MGTLKRRLGSHLESVPRAELRLVGGAMAVSTLLVIAYVLATRPNELAGDQGEYDQIAKFFTDGKLWWSTLPFGDAHASAYRPPIYPLWTGVSYLVLGESPTRLVLVQSLLAAVTVALTWVMARRLFGPRTGVAAAWAVAVFPLVWEWFGLVYTEALAIPLVTLTILLFLERAPTTRLAVGVGALMGIGLLVRPTSLFLFFGLATSFMLAVGWRRGTTLSAISVGVAALVILPWTIRNYVVADGWVPISVQDTAVAGTFNDTAANDPIYPYAWRGARIPAVLDIVTGPTLSDAEFRSRVIDLGVDYIKEHPFSVVEAFYWNGLSRFWDVRRPAYALDEVPFEGRSKAVTTAGLAMYYVLLPLAIYALWLNRRRPTLVIPILAMALGASLVFTIASGTRYRAPLEPLIAILAVSAVIRPASLTGEGPPGQAPPAAA